jgi:hypothetical protein
MPIGEGMISVEKRGLSREVRRNCCTEGSICSDLAQLLCKSGIGYDVTFIFSAIIRFFHPSHSFFLFVFHRFPIDPSRSDAIL